MSNQPVQPGDRVGNYILNDKVGSGAFATVWRAVHHERPSRVVAIKIATDPTFRKHLSREGRLPEIQHPNVVPILDCDTRFADHPYLVMPFYREGSLAELIARHPHGLPEDRVEALLKDILAGLSAAQQQGTIHRDIKPSNILVDDNGRALVSDFGLALLDDNPNVRESLIQSMSMIRDHGASLIGTIAYMAPEILNGHPTTKASDVYSLAIVLFEMLTGRRPAGLELPSQARKNLQRIEYFDGLFYWACRPIHERLPDVARMAEIAVTGPPSIPWQQYPAVQAAHVQKGTAFPEPTVEAIRLHGNTEARDLSQNQTRDAPVYLMETTESRDQSAQSGSINSSICIEENPASDRREWIRLQVFGLVCCITLLSVLFYLTYSILVNP